MTEAEPSSSGSASSGSTPRRSIPRGGAPPEEPRKIRAFPHALVLISLMIVLAQVAGYVLPSGEYQREDRRVVPGTYEVVEAAALPWHSFLTKIPKGLSEAGDIIFFVFLVGGVLGVLRATGAIDALIGAALHRSAGNRLLVVGGTLGLFALGSATIGMAEEYLPFLPVLIALCLALKMDAVVAMGIIVVGYGVGYGAAPLNPFTVQIAQGIAGLAPTSGQLFRWGLLLVLFLVGLHHLLSYARRIEKDPERSLVRGIDYSEGFDFPEDVAMTPARVGVLVSFVVAIAIFAYGSSQLSGWGWYLTELSALFLAVGLIAAVLSRMSPDRVATRFCHGAADLTAAALLIGFARTIEVLLVDARVIDTVVHSIASLLQGVGPTVAAVGMLVVQTVCNFFIPSGSGQAFVTMPIMAPLGDVLGVTRQVAVLAYQFGDGFTNMVVPTNAVLMGMLILARVPYQRWLRFVLPLMAKIYVVAVIALFVAVTIGYQ